MVSSGHLRRETPHSANIKAIKFFISMLKVIRLWIEPFFLVQTIVLDHNVVLNHNGFVPRTNVPKNKKRRFLESFSGHSLEQISQFYFARVWLKKLAGDQNLSS